GHIAGGRILRGRSRPRPVPQGASNGLEAALFEGVVRTYIIDTGAVFDKLAERVRDHRVREGHEGLSTSANRFGGCVLLAAPWLDHRTAGGQRVREVDGDPPGPGTHHSERGRDPGFWEAHGPGGEGAPPANRISGR